MLVRTTTRGRGPAAVAIVRHEEEDAGLPELYRGGARAGASASAAAAEGVTPRRALKRVCHGAALAGATLRLVLTLSGLGTSGAVRSTLRIGLRRRSKGTSLRDI